MFDHLETLLTAQEQRGMAELRALVLEVLGARRADVRVRDEKHLSRERVFRVRFDVGERTRSLIIKCLSLGRSERERLATSDWLPRAGLAHYAPPLLGVAVEARGRIAWHVYEDLGPHALVDATANAAAVEAAVDAIAQVHVRFSKHALLAECRLAGGDLGTSFFAASMRDAQRNVERLLRAPNVNKRGRAVAKRLQMRLACVAREQKERSRLLDERGGPETLQHGDLGTRNILAVPRSGGFDIRLIDWDHCGVGPAIYDLSALLRRFPLSIRTHLVERYRRSIAPAEWSWPAVVEFNAMCETVELARFASSMTWRAVAIARADPEPAPEWAIEDLEQIDAWFDELTPVLPFDGDTSLDRRRPAA